MSCYYHPKVPTLMTCADCGREVCATCSVNALCPGCRLGRAMQTASGGRAISTNRVEYQPKGSNASYSATPPPPTASQAPMVTVIDHSEDDRVLSAVSYPLWPVALFLLVFRSRLAPFVRYHAMQSLVVNALGVGAYFVYTAAANLPVIGWQSAVVLPILLPAWFIIDLYLGVRAYGGQRTRVPLVGEYAQRYSDVSPSG